MTLPKGDPLEKCPSPGECYARDNVLRDAPRKPPPHRGPSQFIDPEEQSRNENISLSLHIHIPVYRYCSSKQSKNE